MVMGKVNCKCLNSFPVLNWASNVFWKRGPIHRSAAGAFFLLYSMFCHLNFWLRNIKNLTAFCTGTNDLTKPRPTSIAIYGGMGDYYIGVLDWC